MVNKICLLGATGSIGLNTLDIIEQYPDHFEVFALSAYAQVDKCFDLIVKFSPKVVVMVDENAAYLLQDKVRQHALSCEVLAGAQALESIVSARDVDTVVAAIVGAAGLRPILQAAKAGKRILLANKEALVMAGTLLMQEIEQSNASILPVDSEHNALFQCMPTHYRIGIKPESVEKIYLTASGGPFLHLPLEAFATITPAQAIKHPKWKMGPKISVDSATLMNKGLEVIEAHFLFQMPPHEIDVLLHPQSIVHSLVQYEDGSLLAQLGAPDMRIPLSFCLHWPDRKPNRAPKLDFCTMQELQFLQPDPIRFPCLNLAYLALRHGGTAPVVLNASNELAVEAFLRGTITFLDIASIVARTLESISHVEID
ncbi:MAG TPA: 1-deoxy-D-xylulose-5-phosphate reductoisomerase, partial [Gammaproteobacteria bacterium]|nr:1-deoxy-D-xylulose-5-phosphate reductoisomerase [Gammaproteobacteria bacterium]